MDSNQIIQIMFLIIVAAVVVFGIVKVIQNKTKDIHSAEDLIDFIMSEVTEKVIPFIAKLALKEELEGCTEYASFKEKCKQHFAKQLYEILSDPAIEDGFNIPDTLKPFITYDNILKVVDKALELEEVNQLLSNTYNNLIINRMVEMQKLDEEVAKTNAEIGVEDETTLIKEDLGIANKKNILPEENYTLSDDDLTEPDE